MSQDPMVPGFDGASLASTSAPQEQVIALLLDALQRLADAGEVDAACRIAGKACVTLRRANPKAERRFNTLLHRLAHRLGPAERKDDDA